LPPAQIQSWKTNVGYGEYVAYRKCSGTSGKFRRAYIVLFSHWPMGSPHVYLCGRSTEPIIIQKFELSRKHIAHTSIFMLKTQIIINFSNFAVVVSIGSLMYQIQYFFPLFRVSRVCLSFFCVFCMLAFVSVHSKSPYHNLREIYYETLAYKKKKNETVGEKEKIIASEQKKNEDSDEKKSIQNSPPVTNARPPSVASYSSDESTSVEVVTEAIIHQNPTDSSDEAVERYVLSAGRIYWCSRF